MQEWLNAPGPAVLEAVVDPLEPPLPARIRPEQAIHFAESLVRREPNAAEIARKAIGDRIRELVRNLLNKA